MKFKSVASAVGAMKFLNIGFFVVIAYCLFILKSFDWAIISGMIIMHLTSYIGIRLSQSISAFHLESMPHSDGHGNEKPDRYNVPSNTKRTREIDDIANKIQQELMEELDDIKPRNKEKKEDES